jgi:DNA-binding ferritin-like protein
MRATVRLSDALASHVDAVRQDDETSDAEAVRECIRRSRRLDDVEERVAELEEEVEQLKREKRLILEEREEKRELATYVEDQRTAEQRRREAGLATRARWFLFGEDRDDE